MNKIHSLPSASTGHINLTSRDKNKANFPFQVLNYIQDERLLDAVSAMYNKRTGDAISPEQILFNMVEALSDGDKMNAFIKAFPDRFLQAGVAEANMIGVAAGMTIGGLVPFVGTFANFATGRVFDQIRQSFKGAYNDMKDEQKSSVRGGQGLAYDQM